MRLFGLFGPPNVDNMKDRRDVEALIKALGHQKDRGVRRAAAEALVEEGIRTLEELCSSGVWDEQACIDRAIATLAPVGERVSHTLAPLVSELLACRSPKLSPVLLVAKQPDPSAPLVDVVRAVKEANEIAPAEGRFTPEIVGGGRVGLTTETAERIRRVATQTYKS